MRYKESIYKSTRFIVFLGCACFVIYLVFLLVSYSSAVTRLEKQFEESTFPRMTELIDQKINLFFNSSVKGLTILSNTLDWQELLTEAVSDPGRFKSRMKVWAADLGVNSVGISDRDRKIVWDYWSDKPITLNPELSRDKWFFDFWGREKIPERTFTLYTEDPSDNYQLYIDRLIRGRSGRPIGSIAVMMPLLRLKEELEQIIGRNERVIILDDKANVLIDISRMETGEGVQTFTFKDSTVKKNSSNKGDPLITKILSQKSDYGHLETVKDQLFFKKTSLFEGAISILSIMDRNIQIEREKERLKKSLIVLFTAFTLFIGGILIMMMLYTERVKHLAIKLELEKSKFEDLLFIITHGFGNEILLLRKDIESIPQRLTAGIALRLSEMSLMVQNSVNAARLDSSKDLIISKPYSFSWQWEKLTGKFKKLSEVKGQTFSASPAIDCIIDNDEEMVYQILANLVSNAVKYAPKNGRVDLSTRMEGDSLFITIRDSGPGFLPEERSLMFLKFMKLSARPTGGERSTGLGLYITKQLADACGIKLTLSQGDGKPCGAVWELEFKTVQSGM
ncbi:MAG TPA: ATP-binding protein [Spirochaetota bacterium]|nr:ATP-binding protein [Spirochaetota bacterium]HPR39314.1 ATP-binding protein [Spirochaetota bacterium]HRX49626.1 ATP-binding protein [Spirochaetota bacterium]